MTGDSDTLLAAEPIAVDFLSSVRVMEALASRPPLNNRLDEPLVARTEVSGLGQNLASKPRFQVLLELLTDRLADRFEVPGGTPEGDTAVRTVEAGAGPGVVNPVTGSFDAAAQEHFCRF